MKIVMDTSALLAVLANEPEKAQIIEKTKGASLIAPSSVHWEIGNALSAMLKRKRIQVQEAVSVLNAYAEIPITFIDVELEVSVRLSAKYSIYAYDAYLLACALSQQCELMTLDRHLAQVAVKANVQLLVLDGT